MPNDNYREVELVDWPGWTRIVEGTNRRYRHDASGKEISNNQWSKLQRQYSSTHVIPESVLGAASGLNGVAGSLKPASTPKPAFMSGATAPKTEYFPEPPPMPEHPDPGAQRLAAAQMQVDEPEEESERFRDNIREIGSLTGVDGKKNPKGTKTDRRYKQTHPRATAAGLGEGIRKLLLLITTLVVAKILNDERAIMSNQEAMILGNALGNMLEPTKFNDQWGWIIADTGDYQAIGYVLIMYGSRIADIAKDRRAAAQGQQQQQSPGMPPPSQNGARPPQQPQPQTPNGGAFLPMKPVVTPPGLRGM